MENDTRTTNRAAFRTMRETPGLAARLQPNFKTAALNHSAILPDAGALPDRPALVQQLRDDRARGLLLRSLRTFVRSDRCLLPPPPRDGFSFCLALWS